MDSNVTKTITPVLSQGMEKSGGDFYAFLAVLAVILLGGLAIWLWFRYRLPVPASANLSNAAQKEDDLKALEGVLTQLLLTQSKTLESMMETKLQAVKESQVASIKALEQKVDNNQRLEDDRLTRIERTVTDGFRTVHDRLDRHIDSHS